MTASGKSRYVTGSAKDYWIELDGRLVAATDSLADAEIVADALVEVSRACVVRVAHRSRLAVTLYSLERSACAGKKGR